MKTKRGRPREFNDVEVKALIAEEFRRHGFAGTSLDDLARTTGLTRPSLYGAFGDKQAMFLMAIDTFSEAMRETAGAALYDGKTVEAALSGFYGAILDTYFGAGETSLGCLVFATAISDAGSNPQIRAHLQQQFMQFEDTLKRRIEELLPDPSKDRSDIIARLSISLFHSIAIRARTGESRVALDRSVHETLAAIRSLIRV